MNDDDLSPGVVDKPPTLITARLESEPLRIDHAEELAPVLDDRRLHRFIGGQPFCLAELRARYERQVVGRSSDGSEQWFNWVVRENASGFAVGQIQATVAVGPPMRAQLAWTIATARQGQGQGYAREAAAMMMAWLTEEGVDEFTADIHPQHVASGRVAASLGLSPTREWIDGEVRWSGGAQRPSRSDEKP